MTDVSRCRQRFEEILQLVDNSRDLTPEECVHIRQHIAECPSCYRSLLNEEQIRIIVRRSCTGVTAPAQLRERIRVQIFTQLS